MRRTAVCTAWLFATGLAAASAQRIEVPRSPRTEVPSVESSPSPSELAPSQTAAFVPFAPAPESGTVKLSVPRERLAEFLATAAAATGELVGESSSSLTFRVDAQFAQSAAEVEGVELRPEYDQVWLRRGVLDTRSGARDASGVPHASFGGRRLALAQLHGPVNDADHAALLATGVELVHYLPQNAFLVWIPDDSARARLLEQSGSGRLLAFLDVFLPEDAVSRQIDGASGVIDVTVQVFNTTASRALRAIGRDAVLEVTGFGALLREPEDVLGGLYTNVTLRVHAGAIETLALLDEVVNVEPFALPKASSERQAQEVRGALNPLGTGAGGPGYYGYLSGAGFPSGSSNYPIVAVVDSGIDDGTTSPDDVTLLTGGLPGGASRVVAVANHSNSAGTNCVNGHGHMCASIIAGMEVVSPYPDGSFLRGLGVSPLGRVSNVKFLDDANVGSSVSYATLAETSWGQGARISSNSWGAPAGGAYTSSAQQHDALVRDASAANAGLQQLAFVFAAGNGGTVGIGSPSTAKNVLTVGATEGSDNQTGCGGASGADNIQEIASFSARGPTSDGRSKPDIVAPGTHVVGTASPSSAYDGSSVCQSYYPSGQPTYTWGNGTSFAAPALSGVASLTWNYLSRVHGVTSPSPALLKAYTLHQTRYLVATGGNLPNGDQGFGMPWLNLAFDQNFSRVLVDQSSTFNATGEQRTIGGTVANTAMPIRIALVWTDAPGSTFGAAWVNDLDLTVTVGGNTYRGNVFSGGLSTTGGSADNNDNCELVVLPTGFIGNISIKVNATNIAGDGVPGNADATDQDYALVIANVALAGCLPASISTNITASATTVCTGSPFSISVGGAGTGLSFKFYRNGQTVQSSSSNTYSVASATANDAGTYTCSISNSCGSADSAPISLTVNSAPAATLQPVGAAVCQGSSYQLTFTASGTPAPTYQWKLNGTNISGATSSTYSIPSMQLANQGSYQCTATNPCNSLDSNAVSVNLQTTPVFSQEPQNVGVCSGANAQLSVALSNPVAGTTYSWLRNNVQVSGATSTTLSLTPVTASNAGTYVCIATNGCGFITSSQAIVTAYALPNITTHPTDQTWCVGVPFSFSVGISNQTPTPSYQWRKNGVPIAGATASNYVKSSPTVADNGSYDCKVTNSCGSSTSAAATYTARVAPSITQQPQSTSICTGVNAVLDLAATGTAPMGYEWFRNGVSFGSFSNSSHTIFNPTSANAGTYMCRVFNACGSVDSNVIAVTVDSVPSIGSHPIGATVCAPSPVSFSVSASGSPNFSYQWRRNGAPIGGATSASFVLAAAQASDAGSYDCVVSSTCTSVNSNPAALVVNVAPQVTQEPRDAVACIGSPASFSVAASGSPAPTYQWRIGGAPLAGQTAASLSIASVAASDFGAYDCVVTNSCGSATSSPASLAAWVPDACVGGGAGGTWPAPGAVDGAWPSAMPTGALVSSLSVTVPAGATRIQAVKLHGLAHTWSGDNQIVLETPSGTLVNLFQEVNGIYGGGCGDAFSGDYEFVDAFEGLAACGAPAASSGCTNAGLVAPGTHYQFFGAWPDGASGIFNVPLHSLPPASGTYTLRIYDWYVPSDAGSLASWDLCFDAPAAPQAYCTAGTTTNGCSASISATANPSASFSTPCTLAVTGVEGAKSGLIFYSISGRNSAPWNGASLLCVTAPTQRTITQDSGGTAGLCNGSLSLDWNAYQLANPAALGNPFGAGSRIWAQGWFRDPSAVKTTNLSNALELTCTP